MGVEALVASLVVIAMAQETPAQTAMAQATPAQTAMAQD